MTSPQDVSRRDPVGVIMCEDHSVLSDAMEMIFDVEPELELLTPPLADPFQAILLAHSLQPQVVLMDIDLGAGIDGIEATRRIKQNDPHIRVLLMTAMQEEELLVKAVEAGASGLLRKTERADKVLEAIKDVARGNLLIDPHQLTRVLQQVAGKREEHQGARLRLDQLTNREREILQMLADGRRSEDIADHLVLSVHTVNTHVRNILAKLGVSSKLEAVVFAARHAEVSVGRPST